MLEGFPAPWWVGGGWAIEAFTGVPRPHEDIDIMIERSNVAELVRHFEGTHHVWAAGSGSLKALLSPGDDLPSWAGQAWIRKDASSPWLVDFLMSQVVSGQWVFKRDPFVTLPFDDATWVGEDGVTYEAPEVTLLHKVKHDRAKDRRDLEVAMPLMRAESIGWLRSQIDRAQPGHPWLELLT